MNNSKKLLSAIALTTMTFIGGHAYAGPINGKTAFEISQLMYTGWNVGNSMDAIKDGYFGVETETAWGNPKITKYMIDNVRNSGFRTLRIPVSWGQHTKQESNYQFKIDDAWMRRVKEIVDYAIDNDMFVILNIHHDNGDQWNHPYFWPSNDKKDQSIRYVTEIWTQVAEYFKDYDQRLIFETLNEPRLIGDKNEWWFWPVDNPSQSNVAEAIGVINAMNQAALDAIRNNGSEANRDRMVMMPGYDASPDGVMTNKFVMPSDQTPNRIGIEVHAYRPTELCLTGDRFYFEEKDKQEIRNVLSPLYNRYITQQIPVIIDETSISDKGQGDETRLQWFEAFYSIAKEFKMPCVLWDNGTTWETYQLGLKEGWSDPNTNGECHGFMNRNSGNWNQPQMIAKIMEVLGEAPTTDIKDIELTELTLINNNGDLSIINRSSNVLMNRIMLFNTNGQLLLMKNNVESLSVSSLPKGIYLIVVETSEGIVKTKVVL